ncbi:50S ribosomal protein L15 [bacterium BMS3Bbin14]|nr:50S ribosomal protein L15 [bacterium BMS3Abin13]GBE52248.1 50S ribosomal protein L15 [bacterium BMS3Bbin14]HDK44080.1 50S ribosomal protein L15 [Desulfobacteraceae bacterium]HDL98887.1 50S ribosomal protein L15 [Desulfobacteraceae bacterium]HDO30630.1 50S ribosomal protein L15 [Desulfobacteraceae bacterium]
MLTLNNLSPAAGSRRNKKRVGRGPGSGHGKTATRGHKGALSRSGYTQKLGFEGGQMPLHRRLPKRGFTNIFKKEYVLVGLSDLNRFESGSTVNREALVKAGVIKKSDAIMVKVLANGDISISITLEVDKVSAGARAKIEAAGGSVKE